MNQIEEKTIIAQVRLNLAFLTAFIQAVKFNPNQKIKDFFDKFHEDIKWDKKDERYSLLNQGIILTSLYGLIVYPKEKFFGKIPKIPIQSLNINEWGKISIYNCPHNDRNLKNMIRRIRNSLSHGRVTIDQNLNFIFVDGKDESAVDFQINISIRDLQKFIEKFNRGCINGIWE